MNMLYNLDLNNEPGTEEFIIDLNHPPDGEELSINLNNPLNLDHFQEISSQTYNQGRSSEGTTETANHNGHVIELNETPEDQEENTTSSSIKKRRFLSNEERNAVFLALLEKSVNEKIDKVTTKNIASQFSVSIRVIQRIWKQVKDTPVNGKVDVSHKKTKNCDRKRVTIDTEQFRSVPLSRRTTLRSLSYATKVSKTTLIRHKNSGTFRRHSNSIKPLLKKDNKKARLQFCISMLEKESIPHDPQFKDMYNVVHIDEKWFYMTKKTENYYLLSNEDEPHRTCKSKNFVEKVMFFAAIARPRFDSQGNVTFSGKIGIFPFITMEPAKRSSVNRPAGTLETKAMTSVGKDTIRSFFIHKIVAAILEKWPREDLGKTIYIQQDNARTHVDPNDIEFCQAVAQQGFDIRLTCQPPNSPDFNVLDLGFFNAIQSLRYNESPKNINELVIAVENAFEEFSPKLSNYIFLTLQQVMMEIMKTRGSNDYKLPHINKSALEREGRLPCQIKCNRELYQEVLELLE